MNAPHKQRTSIDRDLAATAALAMFSLAVAVGFGRVFSGWAFFVDLALLVVLTHGLSFAFRRAQVSGFIAVPAIGVVLVWVLLALQYGDTFRWALPSGATWDLLDLEVGLVREQFQTAIAPVIYGAGWATLAGVAVIITTLMADSFAFRAEARGEALVPGGVLFVFIAALGSPRLRVGATVLLIATAVVAVIALRVMHDRTRRVELTTRRRASMVLPTAVATAAAVALLAGVIGPQIPGAEADPLYNTRGRGGGVTNVLSPLVDIRSRLVNRSNVELFRVNADAPAYWRATTLPSFDGQQFRLPERTLERVEGDFSEPEGGRQVRQQIQVLSLGGKLVPAAADPFRADGFSGGNRLDLRLNRDTNTLVTIDDLRAGDLFTVESATPSLSPDVLRQAGTSNAPDPIFTELPDNLPDVVPELARQVTAGATTAYDQAIMLQTYFRGFEYSLEVQSGHGSNAIESFLNEQVGYCEQFSATFAAMARTLGIPSRVAVGFTPGVLNEDGWYSVLGKNAHAWPELWFDGIGWVPFEPTPGRGAPGAESHTSVPAQQDESGPDLAGGGGGRGDGPGNGEVLPTTPSTVVAPSTTISDGTTGTTLPDGSGLIPNFEDRLGPNFGGELTTGDEVATDQGTSIPWIQLIIIAAIGLVLFGPMLVRRWRHHHAVSRPPTERVNAAWARARQSVELAGVRASNAMTPNEWASATARQLPVAARPMESLAGVVDKVSFSRPGSIDLEASGSYGSSLRHDCELWANQVRRIANDQLNTRQRLKQYFFDFS